MDFLTSFDTRTVALLVSIAFFLQTFSIGMQAFLIREYTGVRTMVIGSLSLAAGFFLSTIDRFNLGDFITIIVARILMVSGSCIYYIAVNKFTEQHTSKIFISTLMGSFFLTMMYFTFVDDNVGARIIAISLATSASTLAICIQLLKPLHSNLRSSTLLTFISFGLYTALSLYRCVSTILRPPSEYFTSAPVEILTFVSIFTLSFLWSIGFILMISQRLQIDLHDLATVDSLTRISNRHAAQLFIEAQFSSTQWHQQQFCILLIDLDNFKQINDQYGHAIGDQVLLRTAEVFQENIRKQDFVGRWGGEEFLVILPLTNTQEAASLAERLRKQVEATTYNLTTSHLTVSIGIASSHGSTTIDNILKKADDALYKAKAVKNTVVVASQPQESHL